MPMLGMLPEGVMTMRDVVLDSGDDVTGLVDEDWSDVETPIDLSLALDGDGCARAKSPGAELRRRVTGIVRGRVVARRRILRDTA
jgi:hypothetical protein